jgi:hypothetical protein
MLAAIGVGSLTAYLNPQLDASQSHSGLKHSHITLNYRHNAEYSEQQFLSNVVFQKGARLGIDASRDELLGDDTHDSEDQVSMIIICTCSNFEKKILHYIACALCADADKQAINNFILLFQTSDV